MTDAQRAEAIRTLTHPTARQSLRRLAWTALAQARGMRVCQTNLMILGKAVEHGLAAWGGNLAPMTGHQDPEDAA